MPRKKHNRRAISMRGIVWQRLRNYCRENNLSMASVMEKLITEHLDALGYPVPDYVEPKKETGSWKYRGQHVTF